MTSSSSAMSSSRISFLNINLIETIKRQWGSGGKNQHVSSGLLFEKGLLIACSSRMGAFSRGGLLENLRQVQNFKPEGKGLLSALLLFHGYREKPPSIRQKHQTD